METRTDRSCYHGDKRKKNATELNMYKEALSLQLNWMCIKKLHHGDKWTGAYKNTTGSKLASNRLHLPMINGSNKIDT